MRVLVLLLPLALGGCLVRTAADVVTMPVKAVGWTADKLTTSQSEADEERGRELRKEDERRAKEEKRRAKELKRQRDQIRADSSF
ncbi:hypothetical protein GON01_04205 [Sphingomonas sp. MAH-20]|uniref:Lipoprotein n=1 Tax=Sphingomonas horti TaxID=2682842 RepID=A0A6I4J0J0_9SPHN|nr:MULTISPECIES: hypothetical protein [Sphingomonas]MBA2918172.1 hypothetical protein [Sphingomonas sp. CGMCC 1.13658]MVO77141.1 hypothetical protein [Sphingomonas horti]